MQTYLVLKALMLSRYDPINAHALASAYAVKNT